MLYPVSFDPSTTLLSFRDEPLGFSPIWAPGTTARPPF